MRSVRAIVMRLLGSFAGSRIERDLDDEIQTHLAMHVDENVRAGMTPTEARRVALLGLGGIEQTKQQHRDRRRLPLFDVLGQDLRYGIRTIRRRWAFFSVLVVVLALGTGLTTAIFSVINGVLLRPLPYRDPNRLYALHEVGPPPVRAHVAVNAVHFLEWRQNNRSFEEMALLFGSDLNITGLAEPERVAAARVSPSLFPMLGVQAQLGRTFLEDEDQSGRDHVVVLSYEYWMQKFSGEPGVLGRTIALDGEPHTIIGVLPIGFAIPKLKYFYDGPNVSDRPQVWKPFAFWNEPVLPNWFGFAAIVRLKGGVSPTQALADINTIQERFSNQFGRKTRFDAAMLPLQERLVGRTRLGLQLMLMAAALVLAIGSVNIAHLLFVRATSRQKEMRVRRAVGATRARLLWQMLTETLIVSLIGGAIGVLTAGVIVRIVQASAVIDLPRLNEVTIDRHVLLFALFTSIAAGTFSTLLPAWQLANTDLVGIAHPAAVLRTAIKANRLRWLLVTLEVAISTLCVVAGGLLLRSFLNIRNVDSGFREPSAVSMPLNVTETKYGNVRSRLAFIDQLLGQVGQARGVRSVGISSSLPLSGAIGGTVLSVEGTVVPLFERPMVSIVVTDPGYFATVGIPLQRGRLYDASDRNRQLVGIVSAGLARRAWPGESAVGKRFRFYRDDVPPIEVVGVVGDIRGIGLIENPTMDVYLPYWQSDMSLYSNRLALVFRPDLSRPDALSGIRGIVRSIDPALPLPAFASMGDLADVSLAPRRLETNVALLIAVGAMLLASLGIYGVVSYTVAQRTHEIGIRLALGAPLRAVTALVFGQSMWPVAAGVAIGMLAAASLGKVLRSVLFGVNPWDHWVFSAAATLLWLVAASAAYFPARRAAHIAPSVALRTE